jgi:hypothetical protein
LIDGPDKQDSTSTTADQVYKQYLGTTAK